MTIDKAIEMVEILTRITPTKAQRKFIDKVLNKYNEEVNTYFLLKGELCLQKEK